MSARTGTGRCRAIREFIGANPGSGSDAIAAGVGVKPKMVWTLLRKMTARGMLVCDESGPRKGYSLGRPVMVEFAATPEESAAKKAASRQAHNRRTSEKRKARRKEARERKGRPFVMPSSIFKPANPEPPKVRAQTVDEFLAAGGVIERLPGPWDRRAA